MPLVGLSESQDIPVSVSPIAMLAVNCTLVDTNNMSIIAVVAIKGIEEFRCRARRAARNSKR
jgi:hypothetical protein